MDLLQKVLPFGVKIVFVAGILVCGSIDALLHLPLRKFHDTTHIVGFQVFRWVCEHDVEYKLLSGVLDLRVLVRFFHSVQGFVFNLTLDNLGQGQSIFEVPWRC